MKKACQIEPVIGCGVYTVPDVSKILGFSKDRIRRWVSGYKRTGKGKKYEYKPMIDEGFWGEGASRAVNFYSLVEMYTFIKLLDLGISVRNIRKAREELKARFDLPYPFASHKLLCDGHQIVIEMQSIDNKIYLLLGEGGQTAFQEAIKLYYKKIDFNDSSTLAERYWPAGKDRMVVVDPNRGFGRPTIRNTNITTEVIFSLYQAGEDKMQIADLYEVDEKAIEDAVGFELCKAA